MTGRGLTMPEMLLSLSLLALIGVAVAGWTSSLAHASRNLTATEWELAATTLLQRIQDDLLAGDRAKGRRASTRPRVRVVDDRLHIDTRAPGLGPVTHVYEWSATGGVVARRLAAPLDEADPRPLIGDVSRWACDVEPDSSRLRVELVSTDGRRVQRSFGLP